MASQTSNDDLLKLAYSMSNSLKAILACLESRGIQPNGMQAQRPAVKVKTPEEQANDAKLGAAVIAASVLRHRALVSGRVKADGSPDVTPTDAKLLPSLADAYMHATTDERRGMVLEID